ncbi:AAA family ATPase [Flavobacterium sp. GSP14]|uniref:AAA family ATPase n=1 Tax=Flavobacterium sp. GSP14 TaxID=3401734 RepID=UPI003AAC90B1
MINNITLKAFKSFLYRELDLQNLTILTGLNSSGKSSIIQSLLILDKAFKNEKNLLLDGHGTESDLKNKNSKESIELGIEIDNVGYSIEFPNNKKIFNANLFPKVWHISANRFGPQLSIPISNNEESKNMIGKNGENVLQCIRYYDSINPVSLDESIKHPDATSFTLLENIRTWLKVISPNVDFNYEVIDISDSSYATYDGFRATNVGYGLSYILPVITTLLVSTFEKNNLVIIENPEAHLHPKGQTELAKLICLCAKLGTQVVVETHSDHIFTGVRLFAKENDFARKTLIHWFELDENRNTDVTTIFVDNDGRVNEWPIGFFDQFELNHSKLI